MVVSILCHFMPIFFHAIVDNIDNVLKDRETFNKLLQQGLDEAY